MEENFEDTLKSTVKSNLLNIKRNLEDLELACSDVLLFLKVGDFFVIEDTINLNSEPRDFGNLKISKKVFIDASFDDSIKFIDDALDLFFDIAKDNEIYLKNLSNFSYGVYTLSYKKEKKGALIYVYRKGVEITEKEKLILLLISQNINLGLENQILDKKLIENINQETKLKKKIETIQKQKDEFVSMAAHELRAPMTAIKGYVSMVIEGDTGDISEKARGFLADANNINDRLIRLVNNMLNVSRIEEGRMLYQIENENLSQAVRAVFSQFTPEAQRKGLEYKLDIPVSIYDKVEVDPDRIQEVIGNLISNAVKYTDSGSVEVRLSQPNKGYVRCEVVDTGVGVSKEEQSKLFQKFQRVESNVGKTTGTGLGLYICKLLVERFNGRIGIESELGKGSNFWFELPLVD